MKENTNIFINDILNCLELDERITRLKNKKEIILSNNNLINNINKLKNLNKYSYEYKELKEELFNNEDFVEFKQLENEINLLILEINQKLKRLTNERGNNICE